MANNKQMQKAGENSQQVQATNIIINNGITEERARAVFSEINTIAIQKFTQDAYRIANERIDNFKNIFMPHILQIEGTLSHFAEPEFQFQLRHAQETAAATERTSDYELLSELLIYHVQQGNDRKKRAGISKAIEIVDDIDNDSLCALTVAYAIKNCYPGSRTFFSGLQVLDDLFGKLMYDELPTGYDWLDHLDILGAIRITSPLFVEKFYDLFLNQLNGYVCVGIEVNSEQFEIAKNLLKSANLSEEYLLPNELLDGYVRLKVPNKISIPVLLVDDNGKKRAISTNEIKVLNKIWDLYEKNTELQNIVNHNFVYFWNKHINLKKLEQWWNNISTQFEITQVGAILAHTNAKRCDTDIPELV